MDIMDGMNDDFTWNYESVRATNHDDFKDLFKNYRQFHP